MGNESGDWAVSPAMGNESFTKAPGPTDAAGVMAPMVRLSGVSKSYLRGAERLVVLDEPTSALDVSVQAQVVDLLRDLQARHHLAYLFISHDLRVVRALAHRIIVLKDGRVVEEGEAQAVVETPQQPYTRALMAAAFDLTTAGSEGTVRT